MTSLQFLGGAETVTGSKYLLSHGDKRILIDCGMFQGVKSLRLQNWETLPLPASEIDAVVLTHAHIDHSGYIPLLVKNGFRGRIYATPATRDLCEILLPDAGYLAEEEAAYLNKHKRTKHQPALPLFTLEEAKSSLAYFKTVPFDNAKELFPGLSFEFRYAGHILGAASVVVTAGRLRIGFTGDVGRPNDPIFFSPKPLPPVDYLVTESTYGNRKHEAIDPLNELEELIKEVHRTNGVMVIPSFAVGRAQEIMYYLWQLKKQHRIPEIPSYLNSPMANDVNEAFVKHHDLHKLSEGTAREVCSVVKYVRSPEESKSLNKRKGPMLIISASGMVSGGRVLHHVKEFAPYENTVILLTGFQAAGTRGEALAHGASEIKIHGEFIPVRGKVKILGNMSAHADYVELTNWLRESKLNPRKVFVTHGEAAAADALRMRLTDMFKWNCTVPSQGMKVELDTK